ncbi:hypothetical protein PRUPE_5G203200 [Prunus persica]|uniref:NAC domain-containing protein n=1 Tax=Prunus persica TaxID=3760 RepID=A0A251PB64_PRUPE|nr:NAC transcription factor 29-like [Prunus persica]ONI08826.1 hypothetical protein PRUPE_5G203200 [Prunus persica]
MEAEHGQEAMMSSGQLPVGFRFMPTDKELVTHYLMNKVFDRPVPAAEAIQDIDATQFYSTHPKNLVTFSCGEREWFFFIHEDDENCSPSAQGRRNIRVVGNGVGFWKPNGSENPIHNEDGNVCASKIFLTYFSGSLRKAKKTHWKMVEYHLHSDSHTEEEYQVQRREWVLGQLKRGNAYNGH